ncbi:hypothetical protein Peur_041474 [Populus x canadensis]
MIAEFGYELLVHRTNEFPFKIFRAMRKFRLLLPATELKVCAETSQEKFLTYIRRSQSFFKETCDFGVLFCWLVSELSGVDPSPLLSKSPSLSIWRTSGSNIKLGSGCRIYFSSDEVYSSGDTPSVLTPKELPAGTPGFLGCSSGTI